MDTFETFDLLSPIPLEGATSASSPSSPSSEHGDVPLDEDHKYNGFAGYCVVA
ncbi:hypothetical protein EWM64_g10049 [Hericium alpestre]|uniref:Pheromone n=1 Tax=Hericium alpestre TaxID=135208 RepID=A0A4Y9ZH68_9AGAM|nr:hypothetical protein EWM64_g10049 [Hericium alpestre]